MVERLKRGQFVSLIIDSNCESLLSAVENGGRIGGRMSLVFIIY